MQNLTNSTNKKGRRKRIAVKCDGCAGYNDRACVINCPTGALEYVSIDKFLSRREKSFNLELRQLLKNSLEE